MPNTERQSCSRSIELDEAMAAGEVGKAFDEIGGPAHFLQIGPEAVQRRTFEFVGKIGWQRLADRGLDFGHDFNPPAVGKAGQRLVERGGITQPGDGFRQHGIGDRFAVGDDAVEVEDQRAHFSTPGIKKPARLICDPPSKWTPQPPEQANNFCCGVCQSEGESPAAAYAASSRLTSTLSMRRPSRSTISNRQPSVSILSPTSGMAPNSCSRKPAKV